MNAFNLLMTPMFEPLSEERLKELAECDISELAMWGFVDNGEAYSMARELMERRRKEKEQ